MSGCDAKEKVKKKKKNPPHTANFNVLPRLKNREHKAACVLYTDVNNPANSD